MSSSMIDRVADALGTPSWSRCRSASSGSCPGCSTARSASAARSRRARRSCAATARCGPPTRTASCSPCWPPRSWPSPARRPSEHYRDAGRRARRPGVRAGRRAGQPRAEGEARHALPRRRHRDRAGRRADHREAHHGARQRRRDRRPQGDHRERLVRRPAVRHRGRLQDLRRVLPRPRPPRRGAGRGPRGRLRRPGLTGDHRRRAASTPRSCPPAVPVRVASPSTDVPTTRGERDGQRAGGDRGDGPSSLTESTDGRGGTSAPGAPEPRTSIRGGTSTSSPSRSITICAWVPPVRIAVATSPPRPGRRTRRTPSALPSTLWSVVPDEEVVGPGERSGRDRSTAPAGPCRRRSARGSSRRRPHRPGRRSGTPRPSRPRSPPRPSSVTAARPPGAPAWWGRAWRGSETKPMPGIYDPVTAASLSAWRCTTCHTPSSRR